MGTLKDAMSHASEFRLSDWGPGGLPKIRQKVIWFCAAIRVVLAFAISLLNGSLNYKFAVKYLLFVILFCFSRWRCETAAKKVLWCKVIGRTN